MKARTTILVNVQRPIMVFGLVPALFGFLPIIPVIVFFVAIFVGWPATGFVAFAIVFAVLFFKFHQWSKRDLHIDTITQQGIRFHNNGTKSPARILQAGGKP